MKLPITPSEGVVFSGIFPLLPKEYGTLTLATGTREPFSPEIYPALLPKESRFPVISLLLPKEYGTPPLHGYQKRHFERIYFGVQSLLQSIENQWSANVTAHLVSLKGGRMCSAICNNLIYKDVFLSCAPRSKFVQIALRPPPRSAF